MQDWKEKLTNWDSIVTLVIQGINLLTFVLVLVNICRESSFQNFIKDLSRQKHENGSKRNSGSVLEQHVRRLSFSQSKMSATRNSIVAAAVAAHKAKLLPTHKTTVTFNRVVLFGVCITIVSGFDPLGILFPWLEFKYWFILSLFQNWMFYCVISFFFFSWIKFFLGTNQENSEEYIFRIRFGGFGVSVFCGAAVCALLAWSVLMPNYSFCVSYYLVYLMFWAFSVSMFLLVSTLASNRAIADLQSRIKRQNSGEVYKLQRKSSLFVFLGLVSICASLVAIPSQEWQVFCQADQVHHWYILLVQLLLSCGWFISIIFNWISRPKRSNGNKSNGSVSAVGIEISVKRNAVDIHDIPVSATTGVSVAMGKSPKDNEASAIGIGSATASAIGTTSNAV